MKLSSMMAAAIFMILSFTAELSLALPPAIEKKLQEFSAISLPAEEPVILVAHLSYDCEYCQRWENFLGGRGDMVKWMRTHPQTHMVILKRGGLDMAEKASLYPPDLQWLYQQHADKQELSPPTPEFEVVYANRVQGVTFGNEGWEYYIFPVLKILEENREKN